MEIVIALVVLTGFALAGLAVTHIYQQSLLSRDIHNTTPATLESASREALIARTREWWNLAAEQHQVIQGILRWDHDISPSLNSEDRIAAENVVQRYNDAVKGGKYESR